MLECQKHLFFLDDREHYLNCAYLSPSTARIEQAARDALALMRAPWLVTADMFFETTDAVRRVFAKLVNAPNSHDVAILPSVSYGIATVAGNIPLSRGQNIVVVEEQFPSNVYSWRRLAAENGAAVVTVSPDSQAVSRAESWNARLLDAIDDRTAVVALPHAHWADGTKFELSAISRRVKQVDAYLVIDGSQSVGAVPIDVQDLKPDALICAGYKWLFGPYSMCLAYYGPRLLEGVPLEENWIAREGSEKFAELVNYRDSYQPGAIRFDVGERSNFLLMPMMLAGLEHVQSWSPGRIQTYCRDLLEPRLETLAAVGYSIEARDGRFSHLVGIRVPAGLRADVVHQSLRSRNVHVSMRGSAIRVSPHVYNDDRDVDALVDALESAANRAAQA